MAIAAFVIALVALGIGIYNFLCKTKLEFVPKEKKKQLILTTKSPQTTESRQKTNRENKAKKREALAEGTIKRLFPERNFGFVETEDGKEVFFYATTLENIRFNHLKEGEPVEFTIMKEPKGLRAVSIRVRE